MGEEATPDFDPDRCQWCGDTGFDLEGLAHHVWLRCEVVERLAEANIESCRQSHERCRDIVMRQRSQTPTSPALSESEVNPATSVRVGRGERGGE